jgi:hypothetical protein
MVTTKVARGSMAEAGRWVEATAGFEPALIALQAIP